MFKFPKIIKTVLREADQGVAATKSLVTLSYRDLSDRFAQYYDASEIDDWQ